MKNKNILIGITGAIAAYKTIELIRLLREQGMNVRVVITEAAQQFVTETTLQAISGNPVAKDLFYSESTNGMPHIELARWPDHIMVAPASADFIARLAYGHANDLLTTICLATEAPIVVVPSMNKQMWENKLTQENIARLQQMGIQCLQPAIGPQACGENGPGRMPEPAELMRFFNAEKKLSGRRILITAGPTREFIDPVRFISNRSSGKMGYALAEAADRAGAQVVVISGPTALHLPKHIQCIPVDTAAQMQQAVLENISNVDIFIGAAAVSDYRIDSPQTNKIKKSEKILNLQLSPNVDIISTVSNLSERPFVVGFSLETENVVEQAKIKLHKKKLDMIIANLASIALEDDLNEVYIIKSDEKVDHLPLDAKINIAEKILDIVADTYLLSADKNQ